MFEYVLEYYGEKDIERLQHRDKKMIKIIGYAKRMELDRYQKSTDKTAYFQRIQKRVERLKEKGEEREKRYELLKLKKPLKRL